MMNIFTSQAWFSALARVLCVFLLPSLSAVGGDIYISQSGSGTTNSLAWLNSTYTWAAGDTVHLVGTFTNSIICRGVGTAGAPITLQFEPNAQFSAPTWKSDIITSDRALSYFIIDGGVNGIITATDNGYQRTYSNSFTAVHLFVGTGFELKNLSLINLFTRTSNTVDCVNAVTAISLIGNMTNVSVHNCIITNIGNGIFVNPYSGYNTNVQIYSNIVWFCSVGISTQPNSSSTFKDGFKIWANRINNGTGWDSCGAFHQEGIHSGGGSGQTNCIIYEEIYRNQIGPDCGHSSTSANFAELYHEPSCQYHLKVYNNIVIMNPGQIWANGTFSCVSDDAIYANNTVINGGIAFQANGTTTNSLGVRYFNNLSVSNSTFLHQVAEAPEGMSPMFIGGSDYNALVGVDNPWNPGSFVWALTRWDGGAWVDANSYRNHIMNPQFIGYDSHTTNLASLKLNADYSPPSNSVIIGLGTNLTSLGVTTDFAGNARPAVGAWTIGAFQTGSVLKQILPPTITTVTPNQVKP